MRRPIALSTVVAFALLVCAASVRAAEPATLADLQAANASKLSKDDLQALIPGGKNESVGRNGNARQFEHGADGRLMGRMYGGSVAASGAPGEGKWSITDDGKYCIDLRWTFRTSSTDEKWCGAVWKLGSDYYVSLGEKPDARAWKQAFRK